MRIPDWLPSRVAGFDTLTPPAQLPPLSTQAIREAFAKSIWPGGRGPSVSEIPRPGESCCLVVSDQTRRTAASRVLPVLLEGWQARGVNLRDLFVLVASGIHRHPAPEELDRILGSECHARLRGRIFLHDPDDSAALVTVGTTRRGHPVRVNRRAVEADRLVLLGAATYHYHAGFGGGRKSLVPGLAARETIAYNHSLTLDPHEDRLDPRVAIGVLDGNPVAEEMLEGARLCKPDLIVNTVLSAAGDLVGVFSGELDAAHRAACRLVEQVSRVDLAEPADLVIASAGTAQNWVQSHKALFNASRAVKENGWIVLWAPCPEGLGNERFRHWVRKPSLAEIYRELRGAPEVLGQTALSTRMRGARAILVTSMPAPDAEDLGIETAPDMDSAIEDALRKLAGRASAAPAPTCFVMPDAGSVVPFPSRPGPS